MIKCDACVMKKPMISVLPAVIFPHSPFLVSYLTWGETWEKRVISLLSVFCFRIVFVISAQDKNDIGKSLCFRIF